MKPSSFCLRRQRGLTLVELMVALLLGLLVLTGVVQMFIANKETYRAQDGLARVQEAGRFAVYLLSSDLAGGGNLGCTGREHTDIRIVAEGVPDELKLDSEGKITTLGGIDNASASETIRTGVTIKPVPGTDVINVRGVSTNAGVRYVSGLMSSNSDDIGLGGGNLDVSVADLLYVGTCTKANVFRASNAVGPSSAGPLKHAQTATIDGKTENVNASAALTDAYGEDAVIGRFRSYWYYVALSTEKFDGQQIYALRRMDEDGVDSELVTGVENMQVVYGINEDDDAEKIADRYVTADGVTDWERVVSMRINLLVNSVSRAARSPVAYDYSPVGTGLTPVAGDLRIRREFAFVTTLRNHTL